MMVFQVIALLVVHFLFLTDGDERKTRTDDISSRIMYPNDFLLMDHHHHHPNYNINSNQRLFPEGQRSENVREDLEESFVNIFSHQETKDYSNSSIKEIPLEFIMNINKYNVTDLLLNFVEGDMEYDEPFIRSRFGEVDYAPRNAAVTPKSAACTPETTTISLASSDDPSILYIPQCTKVERCNGCCSHNLLSCQPKETETLIYQVMKTQYTGAKKLKFIGKEIVHVEKHVKCKCDCKIKEEHCSKYQEYRPSECRCACTNTDEEKKCEKSAPIKLWNSELCACQCRNLLPCSTGYYFDQIECHCMPNPKRRFANYNRRRYATESLTVTPLSDN